MAIEIHVHESQELIELAFTGELDDADIAEVVARYLHEPFSTLRLGLFDLSRVTVADISAESIRALARTTSQHVDSRVERGKLAIVAPSDLLFGMARMYGILRDDSPVEVRVFRERSQAEVWLGLTKRS